MGKTVIYVVGLFKEGKLLEIYHARKLEESDLMDAFYDNMVKQLISEMPAPPQKGTYIAFDKLLPKRE